MLAVYAFIYKPYIDSLRLLKLGEISKDNSIL